MNPAVDSVSPLRVAIAALSAVLLVAAGGCALSRPAPLKHTFVIDAPAPAALSRAYAGTLRVGTISVAAPFRGKAFVYRTSTLGYEADFYSEFLVSPAALIGEATAQALDRSGVFARVVPPGAQPDGDYVLDGFVSALYGDTRETGKPMAELAITYFLTRNDGVSVAPAWARAYQRRIAVAEPAPEGYARALSLALGDILAEAARDLAQAAPARP